MLVDNMRLWRPTPPPPPLRDTEAVSCRPIYAPAARAPFSLETMNMKLGLIAPIISQFYGSSSFALPLPGYPGGMAEERRVRVCGILD